ncbi:hypothetical protein Q5530_24800 [Saccharothrix sp. BKS2]|uniref:hypothetical protein n=1 Tax=Saccharothrix sp. BKS2 TaxID=3064400 RepID=UPI0039EBBD3B
MARIGPPPGRRRSRAGPGVRPGPPDGPLSAPVTSSTPVPGWWMWRPGADRAPTARVVRGRVRRARARALLVPAALSAVALAVLGPSPWWSVGLACAPVLVVGLAAALPVRVDDRRLAWAAPATDVVHVLQFTDPEQRRRATRMCGHFDTVRDLDARWVARVEHQLWRALVALRDSQAARESLRRVANRPGLAGELAEETRELGGLDRRVDRFADALRVLSEELDPDLSDSALRRVASLDPL